MIARPSGRAIVVHPPVWPYWNLMDYTPEGRPDIPTPPQNFRSEFLEKNYPN